MGNSFGYLDRGRDQPVPRGLARVLRPGAHFLIDVATAAESILHYLTLITGDPERHEVGDVSLTNSHRYRTHADVDPRHAHGPRTQHGTPSTSPPAIG